MTNLELVNAGIYMVNQYNNLQKANPMAPLKAYIRSWNFRIVPIFLTTLSTVLGFVPFLIGEKEGFWFPLAAGTIGGLVMSMVGLFVFLPVFMGVGRKKREENDLGV
jgi:multidrug efflux pump subunit AcrB